MLGEQIREKLLNALADSDLDFNSWGESDLQKTVDLVLKVIIDELARGVEDAFTR